MFSSNILDIYCKPEGQDKNIDAWGLEILNRRSNISRIGEVYPLVSNTPDSNVLARDFEIDWRKLRQVYIQSGEMEFIISHDLADKGESNLADIMEQMLASFEIKE